MKRGVAGIAVCCAVLLNCATSTDPLQIAQETTSSPPEDATSPDSILADLDPTRRPLTLQLEAASLGLLARRLGEASGGGIVVMNGLNMLTTVGPIVLNNEPLEKAIIEIAAAVPCKVSRSEGYFFLRADGPVYEALDAVSIAGDLDPRYDSLQAAAVFGVDTPLFNAFALLGQSLGITLIADNAVADALTGELSLGQLPLHAALEALLKSARLNERVFEVESTDEYIFFHHVNNRRRSELLLAPEKLSPADRAMFERRVDVVLPRDFAGTKKWAVTPGAHALGHALESLSEQIGVEVRAEPGLEKLPVNPIIINGVRIRTVMDLILRQWLLAEFAYELTGDVIVIRHVGPG